MIIYGIIGAAVGAAAGFFIGKYFSKIGGFCPILCKPKVSTLFFAVIGFLIGYK
ncbi:MAG: hypothetical protein Q8K98_06170 [Bacteroidota bacterium]|nr:hypothetical protein [Bacteroidota bacterium]